MYGFTTGVRRRRNAQPIKNAGNRTVFPSSEVYHLWANETQARARNGTDTVSFDGPDAYSYRAVIGRIVRNAEGRRAYLISERKWSVTTSCHQSALRQAVPKGEPVFHLGDVAVWEDHDANLTDYQRRMDEATLKYRRARAHKDWHLETLRDLRDEAAAYCEFFSLSLPATLESVEDFIAARLPELEKAEKDRQAKEREKAKIIRERNAENAAGWIAGTHNHVPYNYPDTMLRVNGEEVETSRGARVPLDAARKAYRALVAGVDLTGQRIGHFTISKVTEKQLVIGCHVLDRAEIARLAIAEGWAT